MRNIIEYKIYRLIENSIIPIHLLIIKIINNRKLEIIEYKPHNYYAIKKRKSIIKTVKSEFNIP